MSCAHPAVHVRQANPVNGPLPQLSQLRRNPSSQQSTLKWAHPIFLTVLSCNAGLPSALSGPQRGSMRCVARCCRPSVWQKLPPSSTTSFSMVLRWTAGGNREQACTGYNKHTSESLLASILNASIPVESIYMTSIITASILKQAYSADMHASISCLRGAQPGASMVQPTSQPACAAAERACSEHCLRR